MIKPARDENENPISKKLYRAILKEKKAVGNFPFQVWPEMTLLEEDQVGDEEEEFRIDLMFTYGNDEHVYLGFEAKRLNLVTKKGVKADAPHYTQKGMRRFIDCQYAAGLPMGGMIAYVMDGDCIGARTSLEKRLAVDAVDLGLGNPPHLTRSSLFPACNEVLETRHLVTGITFLVHHVILGV